MSETFGGWSSQENIWVLNIIQYLLYLMKSLKVLVFKRPSG